MSILDFFVDHFISFLFQQTLVVMFYDGFLSQSQLFFKAFL